MSMSSGGATYQQGLVLEQLQKGLEKIEAANDSLQLKAEAMARWSVGVLVALLSILAAPASAVEIGVTDLVFICLMCLSAFYTAVAFLPICGPQVTTVATCGDVDVLYDEYIAKPEDVALNNVLIDTAKAFNRAKEANDRKSEAVDNMTWVLKTQVAILTSWVLAKAFL